MQKSKQRESHQPFNLQREEGGEEEESPDERTDDKAQPEYPFFCFGSSVTIPGLLHTDNKANTIGLTHQNHSFLLLKMHKTPSYFFGLKYPEALSILVNLIPPAQPHQQTAGHILKTSVSN